jgi:hypothetical protein
MKWKICSVFVLAQSIEGVKSEAGLIAYSDICSGIVHSVISSVSLVFRSSSGFLATIINNASSGTFTRGYQYRERARPGL